MSTTQPGSATVSLLQTAQKMISELRAELNRLDICVTILVELHRPIPDYNPDCDAFALGSSFQSREPSEKNMSRLAAWKID